MKKLLFFFLTSIICVSQLFAQDIVTLKVYAPTYIGQMVQLNGIEDYLTLTETPLATSEVAKDSMFTIHTHIPETQKVMLRVGKNSAFMYMQPGGNYEVYFPDKERREPLRPMGNKVEVTLYNLDSTDVNYQILGFNRWLDNFLYLNFKKSKTDGVSYNKALDEFKNQIANYYQKDTGKYIFDYVRFSIATLDDLPQIGNRNKFEKHDFYLKYQPLKYQNDAYMDYFNTYYSGVVNSLPLERNNEVYMAVVKASPSLIMSALGKEYTLVNTRIRELVMIKALGEMYYQKDFPQTSVLAVLDSIQHYAKFEAHKPIAKNMIERLTAISSGGKAPDFVLTSDKGEKKALNDYKGKYLYLQFIDPSVDQATIELQLLENLQKKYHQYVEFVTISMKSTVTEAAKNRLKDVRWEHFVVDDFYTNIWKNYKVESFPYYVLIDAQGYVVQAPALTPKANALYETIDRTFFEIKKAVDAEKERKR